jgi:hypothetical protein
VDGEVVHALLGLLDQRVLEDFPGQVLGLAIHLFQRLVDGHGADGYRRVAQNPLAGFVDVLAGGQVHDGVGTPADAPGHLVHFFGNRRRYRTIADIAVDLHQEIAADDHRLGFRVVDVVGDDGAAGGHFLTHEFRGDFLRQCSAIAVTGVLAGHQLQQLGVLATGCLQALDIGLAVQAFADGNVFHLRGDDALARIVHLADILARQSAARLARQVEAQVVQLAVGLAGTAIFTGQSGQLLGIATFGNPGGAQCGQAALDVDIGGRVGINAAGVIHIDGRVLLAAKLGGGVALADFAHRHADVGTAAFNINLAGIGQGWMAAESTVMASLSLVGAFIGFPPCDETAQGAKSGKPAAGKGWEPCR